jgi:hypothetical protein
MLASDTAKIAGLVRNMACFSYACFSYLAARPMSLHILVE